VATSPTLNTYTADTIQYVKKAVNAKKVTKGTPKRMLGLVLKNSEAVFVREAAKVKRFQQQSA
jgi:hypothetical protein